MILGCPKCNAINGWGFLVLGVLFLLVDLGVWAFWGISWWTALFLWIGVGAYGHGHCKDCLAIMSGKKKK